MSHWNAPDDESHPANETPWLYFGMGAALAVGLHLLMGLAVTGAALAVAAAADKHLLARSWGELAWALWMVWFLGVSLVQMLYLGPAWLLTQRWRPSMAQGILVVAVITALLQSSCYSFFCLGFTL